MTCERVGEQQMSTTTMTSNEKTTKTSRVKSINDNNNNNNCRATFVARTWTETCNWPRQTQLLHVKWKKSITSLL